MFNGTTFCYFVFVNVRLCNWHTAVYGHMLAQYRNHVVNNIG